MTGALSAGEESRKSISEHKDVPLARGGHGDTARTRLPPPEQRMGARVAFQTWTASSRRRKDHSGTAPSAVIPPAGTIIPSIGSGPGTQCVPALQVVRARHRRREVESCRRCSCTRPWDRSCEQERARASIIPWGPLENAKRRLFRRLVARKGNWAVPTGGMESTTARD